MTQRRNSETNWSFQEGMDDDETRQNIQHQPRLYCEQQRSFRPQHDLNLSQRQQEINGILSDLDFQENGYLCQSEMTRHQTHHQLEQTGSSRVITTTPIHETPSNIDRYKKEMMSRGLSNERANSACLSMAIIEEEYDEVLEFLQSNSNTDSANTQSVIVILSMHKKHPKTILVLKALLASGHSVNSGDTHQRTALFYAANDPEFLRLLISHGADVNHKDALGRNALFHAIYAQNALSASLLIEAGCDLNAKDDFDHTPLILASAFGNVFLVELLVNHGADINVTVESEDWKMTPLSLAIKYGNHDIARALVSNGADLEMNLVHDDMIWDMFTIKEENVETVTINHYDDEDMIDVERIDIGSSLTLDFDETPRKHLFPAMKDDEECSIKMSRGKEEQDRMLMQFMCNVQKDRKLEGLIGSELISALNIPQDVLYLIASPLVWH